MIQNILVYKSNNGCESDLVSNLAAMGYHCATFQERFADYHMDAAFMMHIMNCIREEDIQMVFSWDYVPLLATACEMQKIPYVSWICDLTGLTLLSKTILYPHNYLFCFDGIYSERLADLGCCHVYHYPLGVDAVFFDDVIRRENQNRDRYIADISMTDFEDIKEKRLDTEGLSQYARGYIAGIQEAQIRVYGYNFVEKMLDEEIARDIQSKMDLELGDMFFDNPSRLAAQLVNREITETERARVVRRLSRQHRLDLYTHMRYDEGGHVAVHELSDPRGETPLIFCNSRINLNITPRSIESGIPQKVLNILACGGFCLTNYQPEIAESFEDGVDLVMYTDMEDMAQKAEWYLQNEEERAAVARAGCEKVRERFSLRERLSGIMATVEDDMA